MAAGRWVTRLYSVRPKAVRQFSCGLFAFSIAPTPALVRVPYGSNHKTRKRMRLCGQVGQRRRAVRPGVVGEINKSRGRGGAGAGANDEREHILKEEKK